MNKSLIEYYIGKGTDSAGRTFDEAILLNERAMEKSHDVVQWVFPTITPSQMQKHSPVLDDATIKILKDDLLFKSRYKYALEKYLTFWRIPFRISPYTASILIDETIPDGLNQSWTYAGDHNQLRLARVLESTRLLGLENTSRDLFHALIRFVGKDNEHDITARNVAYWYKAAYGINIF